MARNSSSSRQIVVDASVARSAGGPQAIYPTSKHCRDTLQAILTICHRMVVNDAILSEWNEHQSGFARKWRVQMNARKKMVRQPVEENGGLRSKVTSNASDANREAMLKDMHLLETALVADQMVISLDNAVRTLFADASQRAGEIGHILWVHPDEADVLKWLADGAAPDTQKQLRYYGTPDE